MHLKAIKIKEELLGPEDYEVGLSIGHLASLYNFHMGRFRDAEQLYYRSIAISKLKLKFTKLVENQWFWQKKIILFN